MKKYVSLSLVALLSLGVLVGISSASLVVDHAYYQKSYYITSGGPQNEGGTPDTGGAVFLFVRNTGASNENIWANPNGMVKCNGTWVNNISGFRWARSWPETI